MGRTHRTVTPAIRKALVARDRGCRWPGCTGGPQWTDGHHFDHWNKGGHTRVDRMLLLCRYHHRQVHEGRWTIDFDPTTAEVTITRPDGGPYELNPTRAFIKPTERMPT